MSDLHTENAKKIFNTDTPTDEQRYQAKLAAFRNLYGGRGSALSTQRIIPRFSLRHWLRPMRLVREIIANTKRRSE